jgi:hypothetical protein
MVNCWAWASFLNQVKDAFLAAINRTKEVNTNVKTVKKSGQTGETNADILIKQSKLDINKIALQAAVPIKSIMGEAEKKSSKIMRIPVTRQTPEIKILDQMGIIT